MIGPPDGATEEELRRGVDQLSALVARQLADLDRRARAAGYWPLPGLDVEVET